jgi:DNA repair exonuclease SbcCD ATPase subunit
LDGRAQADPPGFSRAIAHSPFFAPTAWQELQDLEELSLLSLEDLEQRRATQAGFLRGAEAMLQAAMKQPTRNTANEAKIQAEIDSQQKYLALIDQALGDASTQDRWSPNSSQWSDQAHSAPSITAALQGTTAGAPPETPEAWRSIPNPALGSVATPDAGTNAKLQDLTYAALTNGAVEDVQRLAEYAKRIAQEREDLRQQTRSLAHHMEVLQTRELDLASHELAEHTELLQQLQAEVTDLHHDIDLVTGQVLQVKAHEATWTDLIPLGANTDRVERLRLDIASAHAALASTADEELHALRQELNETRSEKEKAQSLCEKLKAWCSPCSPSFPLLRRGFPGPFRTRGPSPPVALPCSLPVSLAYR